MNAALFASCSSASTMRNAVHDNNLLAQRKELETRGFSRAVSGARYLGVLGLGVDAADRRHA